MKEQYEIRTPGMSETLSPVFGRAAFKKYAESLGHEQVLSDATFSGVVRTAVREFGLAEGTLRDAFGLSQNAAALWMERQSLPQPEARPVIAAWISQKL